MILSAPTFAGTLNYFGACYRKLWLYLRGVERECENENVQIGKPLDEERYQREQESIRLEENETLFVLLFGAVNASVAQGSGTGTITNDDASG